MSHAYTLYFNANTSIRVEVEADDLESAIEAGYDNLPGTVCAQCSGMGSVWSRDEGDYEFDDEGYYIDGLDPLKSSDQ